MLVAAWEKTIGDCIEQQSRVQSDGVTIATAQTD
jgi:hypothetical protein